MLITQTMKKIFLVSLLTIFAITLTGCNKTDIENELNYQNENQELMTQEEANLLNKEDQEFQEDYLRELSDATEEQRVNEGIELIDEIENSKAQKNIKGSCNAISQSSTCIEYYGSFWTIQEAKLHCSDSGIFSTAPCPVDTFGGCNTGVGTAADMVAWMYLRGGGDINQESIKYAKMACDATLASNWINR